MTKEELDMAHVYYADVAAVALQHPALTVFACLLFLFFASWLLNLKNFPLIWHLRLANGLRFVLRSQRTPIKEAPAAIFRPVVTQSHSPVAELDLNLHSVLNVRARKPHESGADLLETESNSTYFTDLDIARTHLISAVFSKAIEATRFEGSDGLIGGGSAQLFVMLGSVSCTFKKEIKPYEQYEMWSRILSWNNKWFYILTHFVTPCALSTPEGSSGSNAEPRIFASAVSKMVFKKGRLSVNPNSMLQLSGLLPASFVPGELPSKPSIRLEKEEEESLLEEEDAQVNDTKPAIEARRWEGRSLTDKLDGLEASYDSFDTNIQPLAIRQDESFIRMSWRVGVASIAYYIERYSTWLEE